ncbi:MAG TPA: hypothetical protein VK447_08980, partial [Myxococcaceae bacterium]|nr:hypothetical protein [Myxococcaceae bacterium]
TLVLLAMQDNFAHPEFGSPLRELSPAKIQLELLTRLNLLSEDYTHLSLLHGADAPSELFGPILRFLDKADPSARDGQDAEALR